MRARCHAMRRDGGGEGLTMRCVVFARAQKPAPAAAKPQIGPPRGSTVRRGVGFDSTGGAIARGREGASSTRDGRERQSCVCVGVRAWYRTRD